MNNNPGGNMAVITPTRLIDVDPASITVKDNVRSKLGELTTLTESIRKLGVLVPLIVREDGDLLVLVAGARRRQAAINAGRPFVPVIVTANADEAATLEQQLVENMARENLSAVDVAQGYAQLALLGFTEDDIARSMSTSPEQVRGALAIAASKKAVAVSEKHDLTFDQAAALAEFDSDNSAVKELTVAAKTSPGKFEHTLSLLRQDRDRRAQVAALTQELTDAGVKVVPKLSWYIADGGPVRLASLYANGKQLTEKSHAKCEGHVAWVHPNEAKAVYGCSAPKKYGHTDTMSNGSSKAAGEQTTAEREKASEERKAVLAGNREWRAATPVRVAFLKTLLARKTPPRGTLTFVAEEIMGDPDSLGGRMGPGNEDMLADLLGTTGNAKASYAHNRAAGLTAVRKSTEGRQPLVLLAQVAADREQTMAEVQTWRRVSGKDGTVARWLRFLASVGYELADIERKVADGK